MVKARDFGRIMIITGVLATFVLYLCAGVSKLLPFVLVALLVVLPAACAVTRLTSFTSIIFSTQKRE